MSTSIDPELKARIVAARSARNQKIGDAVDRMRRNAKALTALMDAISPLPISERVEMLEDVLQVLDPQTEEES
jgi:hypothetical protein